MSAPSRLKVFVCPRCGEQQAFPGSAHMHDDQRFAAEEVEVIPVADAQKIEAERDRWKGLTLKAEGELARLAEETGWRGGQQREGGLPGEIATPVDHALYGCAKRGCDRINPDWESYGAYGKSWCLGHAPLRIRLQRWLGREV